MKKRSILIMLLVFVFIFAGCGKVKSEEPSIPTETTVMENQTEAVTEEVTEETKLDGLEDSVFDDVPEETTEAAPEDATEAETTKPEATEPSTEKPTEKPTEAPTEKPTEAPSGDKEENNAQSPSYDQFQSMGGAEQQEYMNSFGSMEEFFDWYNSAKDQYEAQNPDIEINGGSVDLGGLGG